MPEFHEALAAAVRVMRVVGVIAFDGSSSGLLRRCQRDVGNPCLSNSLLSNSLSDGPQLDRVQNGTPHTSGFSEELG